MTALPASDSLYGSQISAIALSPDGQALAAFATSIHGSVLVVFYLKGGTSRGWVWRRGDGVFATEGISRPAYSLSAVVLSWTANGKAIGFAPDPWGTVWVLDIAKPSDNLKRNSSPMDIRGVPVHRWSVAELTPDGKSAFVSYRKSYGQSAWIGLDRFSATTGQLTVINKLTVRNDGMATGFGAHASPYAETAADNVLWTSYDGSKFVVVSARPGNTAGIYSGSRYMPMPWSANIVNAAW